MGYSFLTKSAKIKLGQNMASNASCYSFLTKSAKIKLLLIAALNPDSYSFLTKSAKIKPFDDGTRRRCAIVSLQNRLK